MVRSTTSSSPVRLACVLALALFVALVHGHSRAQTVDPAARGLDVFLQAPRSAPAGAPIRLLLRTYGYRTPADLAALGAVQVDAAWQSAGADEKPSSVLTDERGLGSLALTVPDGPPGDVVLVVALSHGSHRRTREIKLTRVSPFEIVLTAPTEEVAPGTLLPVWARLVDKRTGAGAPGRRLTLELREGKAATTTVTATTDRSGSTTARLRVPRTELGDLTWDLVASSPDVAAAEARATLRSAAMAPAAASLRVRSSAYALRPGARATLTVRATAGTGEPLPGQRVRHLVLREGEAPPSGRLPDGRDAFDAAARVATTNELGEITTDYVAPTTTVGEIAVRLVARAQLEGRDVEVTGTSMRIAAKTAGTVVVAPEGGELIPGLEQQVFLRLTGDHGDPIQAPVRVEADGLSARVQTDADGAAVATWKVPLDVGTRGGPCSSDVAATVAIHVEGAADRGPYTACADVDRDRRVLVRTASRVAVAGSPIEMTALVRSVDKDAPGPLAVSFGDAGGAAWLDAAPRRAGDPADVVRYEGKPVVPSHLAGPVAATAHLPRANGPALVGSTLVLVRPALLPRVVAKVVGGRQVPGGRITVEATMSDGAGRPLVGAIAAAVVDAAEVPYPDPIWTFDTATRLCREGRIESRCDQALAGEPLAGVGLGLSRITRRGTAPPLDPGAVKDAELEAAFQATLKSLEGALFQASTGPDVRDVLRKKDGKNTFNPELFTVVTSAMSKPPELPGGDAMTLADLASVDPQVQFDVVARRVARLKLFRLLVAAREFKKARGLDDDEPALQTPSALLRRWKEEGRDAELFDPWGGALSFVPLKGARPRPFLSPIPGFELVAPGPDGKAGTADDVRDPFVRVLRSGTPYAEAMGEDRIVDAPLDLRVADATIAAWEEVLSKYTGTVLGDEAGFGSGHGRLGGSHRTKSPQIRMGATSVSRPVAQVGWSAPVRTDARGVARIDVDLGGDETKYRVLALGMPDTTSTCVGTEDVVASLPLSVRARPGDRLTDGDVVHTPVTLRNRTSSAITAEVKVEVRGAGRLGAGESSGRQVVVPANGGATTFAKIEAKGRGELVVRAVVSGGGHEDQNEFIAEVEPRGRPADLSRARFVETESTIPVFSSDARTALEGKLSLVAESGALGALRAALSDRWLEEASTAEQAADLVELYGRALRHAATLGARGKDLERRAEILVTRAGGRYLALRGAEADDHRREAADRRVARYAPTKLLDPPPECPSDGTASDAATWARIEAEPQPVAGAIAACWDAAIQEAVSRADKSRDPSALARLVLALAERGHRHTLGAVVAGRLEEAVAVGSDGTIRLSDRLGKETRVLVYAALARGAALGWVKRAKAPTLLGWLEVQRAADGGYGSIRASRAALSAVLAVAGSPRPTRLTVTPLDADGDALGEPLAVTPDETGAARVTLEGSPAAVRVTTSAAVLVRIEQRALLRYREADERAPTSPAATFASTLTGPAVTGRTASLELSLRAEPGRKRSWVATVPLPPGVRLAERVTSARELPGKLIVQMESDESGIAMPVLLPLRFGLGGSLLLPPAVATDVEDPSVRTESLAQRLSVAAAK